MNTFDSRYIQNCLELLKTRGRIAVICAAEPEPGKTVLFKSKQYRHWKSYREVGLEIADSLTRSGFRHVDIIDEDIHLLEKLTHSKTNLAWINSAGVQGRDSVSHAAAMCELSGISYLGHSPLTSALMDNKAAFKSWLRGNGLPTAPFIVCHPRQHRTITREQRDYQTEFSRFYDGPFIVKPVHGRGSRNVHFADNLNAVNSLVQEVYRATGGSALVEKFLPGREYTVAGSYGALFEQSPFAFGHSERMISGDEKIFTSMDIAPINSNRITPLRNAADSLVVNSLSILLREIYTQLALNYFVRLDVRADEDGAIGVLEMNHKPDLKFPSDRHFGILMNGAQALGISPDDMILSAIADFIAASSKSHKPNGSLFEVLPQEVENTPKTKFVVG